MRIARLASVATAERRAAATRVAEEFAGNTGNMLFDFGLRQLFPELVEVHDVPEPGEVDGIVLSLANLISSDPIPSGPACFWRSVRALKAAQPDLKVGIMSVGSDYPALTDRPVVHPDKLAIVRDLADWAPVVGVRGEFTAELLADVGIHNVRVLGDPALALPAPPAWGVAAGRPVVGWTPVGRYRDKLRELLLWSVRHGAGYVVQSAGEGFGLGGQSRLAGTEQARAVLDYFLDGRAGDVADVLGWAVEQGRWFPDVEPWVAHVCGFSLGIGTRYHGNAAVVRAGRPALLLTVDTRTQEMATFHGLPSMPLNAFDPRLSPEDYLTATDMSTFVRRLPEVLAAFRGYWWEVFGGPREPAGPGWIAHGAAVGATRLPAEAAVGARAVLRQVQTILAAFGHEVPDPALRAALGGAWPQRPSEVGEVVDRMPGILDAVHRAGRQDLVPYLEALVSRIRV